MRYHSDSLSQIDGFLNQWIPSEVFLATDAHGFTLIKLLFNFVSSGLIRGLMTFSRYHDEVYILVTKVTRENSLGTVIMRFTP